MEKKNTQRRVTVKVVGPVAGGQDWETDGRMRGKGPEEGERKKKTARTERKTYETPAVNETAYLSAVSVMCKQRPFRAARHTIALFAVQ